MQDKQIAKILLKTKAVELNMEKPFTYTSGMLSPIYVDNRILISYPRERGVVINKLGELIKSFGSKNPVLAGTATAAIPWAAFAAQKMGLPMAYVRPKPKEHGAGKQVEGHIEKGADVIVVEDLISTGGSSLGSVKALEKECSANVLGIVVIFNYKLPEAVKNFEEAGIEPKYLTDFETVVNTAVEEKYIEEDDREDILRWQKEGMGWGKSMGFIKNV